MKIKTSELTGRALDWAVAKTWVREYDAEGSRQRIVFRGDQVVIEQRKPGEMTDFYYTPSTDWAYGGPLIERFGVHLCSDIDNRGPTELDWEALIQSPMRRKTWKAVAGSPLVAACRVIVRKVIGAKVDVPDELVKL
jgi:hypothetical protein